MADSVNQQLRTLGHINWSLTRGGGRELPKTIVGLNSVYEENLGRRIYGEIDGFMRTAKVADSA
jgi:hypothetical protein